VSLSSSLSRARARSRSLLLSLSLALAVAQTPELKLQNVSMESLQCPSVLGMTQGLDMS
jgi:hypothetical protein